MYRIRGSRLMPIGILLLTQNIFAQADLSDSSAWPVSSYQGNRNQFTIDVPDGWHIVDQSPYSDTGVVAFYSRPLEAKYDKDAAIYQQNEQAMMDLLDDMLSGAVPSFFMDRYKASKGMSCEGFDARAQKKKLKIYTKSDALGTGSKVVGKPDVSTTEFGGCKGLRVLILADSVDGKRMQMLVYSAAVAGLTYDFVLLAEPMYFDQNLPWFERAIASVRLTAAQ